MTIRISKPGHCTMPYPNLLEDRGMASCCWSYFPYSSAISLALGIVFATSIILVIVPGLYMILDDTIKATKKKISVCY